MKSVGPVQGWARHSQEGDRVRVLNSSSVAAGSAVIAEPEVVRANAAVPADARARPRPTVADAEDEFHEFVALRWTALLRTAYLLTGDRQRAEDLVQSALVRLHRHWPKVRRDGMPEAYARRIMINLNIDWWRRLGSREHSVESVPDRPTTADAFARFELREELWSALHGLAPRTRAVLVLRYFEDLSEAETAAVLGCSVGSVKSQSSRGLAKLRLSLGSAQ